MPLDARAFWQPKDEGFSKEYEDAYALSAPRGIAAIADGVASAMFSGRWAKIITEAVVERPPDPRDPADLANWLEPLRLAWDLDIDRPHLNFFQREKLRQAGGGYTTLLWLEVFPRAPTAEDADPTDAFAYRSFAVGDCCLFHVRDGQLLRSFPMENSEAFNLDPMSICSVDRKQDHLIPFAVLESTCREGDLLVLATDALAACIFRQMEAEIPICWEELWEITEQAFADRVRSWRTDKALRMRYDDTTLVMARVVSELKPAPVAEEPRAEIPEIVAECGEELAGPEATAETSVLTAAEAVEESAAQLEPGGTPAVEPPLPSAGTPPAGEAADVADTGEPPANIAGPVAAAEGGEVSAQDG